MAAMLTGRAKLRFAADGWRETDGLRTKDEGVDCPD
jgi:hypothetical protein